MESLQSIKSRLKAIKNVGQITKAMEVVSATKMRRAQETALNSRPYALQALALLRKISVNTPLVMPLTETRFVLNTLVVVVTSDKGLAGSFNSQVLRAFENFLNTDDYGKNKDHAFHVAAVGKKAHMYALRRKFKLVKSFYGFGDFAKPEEIGPLSDFIVQGFVSATWDRVVTISTHFRTTLKQEVLKRQILPLDLSKIEEAVGEIIPEHGRYAELGRDLKASLNGAPIEYIWEPSPEEALKTLMPHLVKMQIYHLVLEANASEHSARRIAMKAASDNAAELSGALSLSYNKARQAGITKELIEIVSTQTSLSGN